MLIINQNYIAIYFLIGNFISFYILSYFYECLVTTWDRNLGYLELSRKHLTTNL